MKEKLHILNKVNKAGLIYSMEEFCNSISRPLRALILEMIKIRI